uniref:NADH-ubiquinone oxidoreductase chain 5 n=1 Tax=Columbicola passerinae TaxID=128994 RepID=A0A6G8QS03_9NEOP|nr:NADH dehydrogenase subunit 5 [Columbicola passerinae]
MLIFLSKKLFHFFSLQIFFLTGILMVTNIVSNKSFLVELKLGSVESCPSVIGSFLFDLQANVFLLMVSSVSFLVVKYAYWYMHGEKKEIGFFVCLIMFICSMVILVSSTSLFWVMLGWDGLGITSFCLVMFFSNWSSYNSSMITLLMNRFGDFFFFLSIWGCFFFSNLKVTSLLGIFLVVTAMTKSAQIPFSAWLPAAMAAPTPVSSLVHSSTLVTAGIYLLIRFFSLLSDEALSILCVCSIMTILVSGMSALGEMDLKKIIAFSTLSHLGFMMFFLSKNEICSTMVHLLTHAFFKSLLFMTAGVLIHMKMNSQDIRQLSFSNFPVSVSFYIAIFANMGIPFLSGFYSKEILVFSVFSTDSGGTLVDCVSILLSIILTSLYSVRILGVLSQKNNLTPTIESLSFSGSGISTWIFLSSTLSCIAGGSLLWFVVDQVEVFEDSFFLQKSKLLILSILITALLSKGSFPILFSEKSAKMWFSFEVSKFFSNPLFYSSFNYLWTVDLKGLMSKAPDLGNFSLKDKSFVFFQKKIFIVWVWAIMTFFLWVNLFY